MVYFNSINKQESYVELTTKDGEKHIIPANSIIYVEDGSGMVSIKNTASRKTIGLISEEAYHKNPDEPEHYKVWGYLTDGSVYVIPENGDSVLKNSETSRYRDTMATANIGTGVTEIDIACFQNFSSLTSITIHEGVLILGAQCFDSCPITDIVIPDSVTEMRYVVFQGCGNLISITVGANVKKMGSGVFNRCYALEKVIMKPIIAPQFTFAALNIKSNGTLYVPIGSTGYDEWMLNEKDHFGYKGWTKVEQ